jgi:hypothetical protein
MSEATTVPAGTPAVTADQVKDAKVKAGIVAGMKAAQGKDAAAQEAKPEVARNIQLPPARMQSREYENLDHTITIESKWTMEDVLKPIFWASCWQKMRRYDEVTVRVDDGSWWAKLLVVQVGTGFAFVRPIAFAQLTGETAVAQSAPAQFEGFEVRELGPFKKWCVVRTADSQVLKEKCDSRRDADDWLQNYKIQQADTLARAAN